MNKEDEQGFSYPYDHEFYSLFWAELVINEQKEDLPEEVKEAVEIILERNKDLEEELMEKEQKLQQGLL